MKYFSSSGKEYVGKERKCEKCGKNEVVIKSNKNKNCKECARKYRKDRVEYNSNWKLTQYFDSSGKEYVGKEKICPICKKKYIVTIYNNHKFCRKCNAEFRKSTIKEGEKFLVSGKNKSKVRAVDHSCKECGKKRLVRKGYHVKSDLCKDCYIKIFERKYALYKDGIGIYRKVGMKKNDGKCLFCGEHNKIEIHHADCNRRNNLEENLIPLCKACHVRVHQKLKLEKKNAKI